MVNANAIKDAKVYEKTLEEIVSNSAKIVEINKSIGFMNTFSKLGNVFNKVSKARGSSGSKFSFQTSGAQLATSSAGSVVPNFNKILSGMTLLSKITSASKATKFAAGFGGSIKKMIDLIPKALKGATLLIKPMIGALMSSLAPLLPIILGVAFVLKTLSSAWKVNAGGMQTMSNALRGKWAQGMAKMNLAFVQLGRALSPIIKPLVDFVGAIGGGLIDGLFLAIEFFTNFVTGLINGFNILQGLWKIFIGTLYTTIGNLLGVLGFGDSYKSLGEYLSSQGKEQYDTGMQWYSKDNATNTTTNNNITFNVSGSSMSEDSYLAFSNKILGVIG